MLRIVIERFKVFLSLPKFPFEFNHGRSLGYYFWDRKTNKPAGETHKACKIVGEDENWVFPGAVNRSEAGRYVCSFDIAGPVKKS